MRSHGRARRVAAAASCAAWALALAAGPWTAVASADDGVCAGLPERVADQDREISRSNVRVVVNRLESLVGRNPNDGASLHLLARAYGKAERWADALATYTDALKQLPGCPYTWRERGIVRAMTKDLAGAEADLRKAVALKPDFLDALQDLAGLLMETKRPEEAIEYLRRVVDADPLRLTAQGQLVDAYLRAHKPVDALRALEPLLTRYPTEPALLFKKAHILDEQGDKAGAIALFKRLAEGNPAWPQPLVEFLRLVTESKEGTAADQLWALERLLRLAKTDEERRRISEAIDKLRAGSRPAAAPPSPPTGDQLAALLRGTDAAGRKQVLEWVIAAPPWVPAVEGEFLKALLTRIVPANEPVPENRMLALVALAHLRPPPGVKAGWVWGGLVRQSLRDEVPEVRARAADVLAFLGGRNAVAALVEYAKDAAVDDTRDKSTKDIILPVAARAAVYALADVRPPDSEDTPEAQAKAFVAWWKDPERVSLKLKVIEEVLIAGDAAPEELLWRFALLETDADVWKAAYKGLVVVADGAKGASAREVKMRALPKFSDADLVPARAAQVQQALTDWFLAK